MENKDFFIPDQITIFGGNPTSGSVDISGAKNAILGLMAAALLTDKPVILQNVPNISDVLEMGHILKDLGVEVRFNPAEKVLFLHARKITTNIISDKAAHFRASYYLWGSLLARFRRTEEFDSIKVLLPGGCSFGAKRKTDYHEQLVKSVLGTEITEVIDNGRTYLNFKLKDPKESRNSPVYATLKASHGATYHWLLSVAGSDNVKMMYNSALEPEIPNLVNMLREMGLGLSDNERTGLVYDGKNRSLLNGGTFYIIPDRMETATYALLSLITKGEIQINNINFESCRPWFEQLNNMFDSGVYYSPDKKQLNLDFRNHQGFKGQIMQITPFPGTETDLQQIWTPVLGMADTESLITDMIWPGRQGHLAEMAKFGLKCEYAQQPVPTSQNTDENVLLVHIFPSSYKPAKVSGMDLRGTMALIMMAAGIKGKNIIDTPSYALRGYPNLLSNMEKLGIDLKASKKGATIEALPEYMINAKI